MTAESLYETIVHFNFVPGPGLVEDKYKDKVIALANARREAYRLEQELVQELKQDIKERKDRLY